MTVKYRAVGEVTPDTTGYIGTEFLFPSKPRFSAKIGKNNCFSEKRHSFIDRLSKHLNCSADFYLERTELLWNPSSSSTCIAI